MTDTETSIKINNDRMARPFTRMTLEFNSPQMSKAFEDSVATVDNLLFRLTRAPLIPEDARELVSEQLDTQFKTAEARLENSRNQCTTLLEAGGIEVNIEYTTGHTVEGILTCPHTRRFMKLAKDSDAVISIIDTLWLSGSLDDKQAGRASYELTRNLFKFRGQLINLGNAVRTEKREKRHAKDHPNDHSQEATTNTEAATKKENILKAERAQMQSTDSMEVPRSETEQSSESTDARIMDPSIEKKAENNEVPATA